MIDYLLLLMVIFLPLIIPVVIVVLKMGGQGSISSRINQALVLHASKGLSEQGLLWLSIAVPFTYALIFGFISWQGHTILLTGEGLSNFLKISAFPIAFISLSLPLAVLVSRLHATKQTAEQIRLTRVKNNVDLFQSHRKELFSYFAQIGDVNYLDCFVGQYRVHPRVHKIYFVGNQESGTPTLNLSYFQEVEGDLNSVRFFLDMVIRNINPALTFDAYLSNFCSRMYRVSAKLGLPEIYEEMAGKSVLVPVKKIGDGPSSLITVGTTTNDAIASFRYAYNFFKNLSDFAGYVESKSVDPETRYIDEGDKYLDKNEFLVIEKIHKYDIPEMQVRLMDD
ncbi:Uncharacterised protein [Serratia rubidaea]|uniref:Uncharacterized protein n=1 Tax=Serratia rubidaea TaxID=61652 RepID=A0A447QS78_SERRU|nr:Uncharacterised protein [Serratia rubidaea]